MRDKCRGLDPLPTPPQSGAMTIPAFDDLLADFDLLEDRDQRWQYLIELGRALEPMPQALKTDATRVRGCSANVWVYPMQGADGVLHFLADSDAGITKGVIALIVALVQDRTPFEIVATDITATLAPFNLSAQLSSNRTQGIPNMIALIRETAERLG